MHKLIAGVSAIVLFIIGNDVAEMWSDEKYSNSVHNVNHYMNNEEYAKGSLHPWLVKACEASRGWSWHTHTDEVQALPTVRELVATEIRRRIKTGIARIIRVADKH